MGQEHTVLEEQQEGIQWDVWYVLLHERSGRMIAMALLMILVGNIILDQVTKEHAQRDLLAWEDKDDTDLYQGKRYPVFTLGSRSYQDGKRQNFLSMGWQYSRNKGAAFSMLSHWSDSIRVPFFYTVTALAIIFISYFFLLTPANQHWVRVGLIFILSGALGNCIDRMRHGYVIDFIDFEWNLLGWHHDFAIFNVADVCINIGVYCMIIQFILDYRRKKRVLTNDER